MRYTIGERVTIPFAVIYFEPVLVQQKYLLNNFCYDNSIKWVICYTSLP